MATVKTELILYPLSRVAPAVAGKAADPEEDMDSVRRSYAYGDRRAFRYLLEAQHYWNQMDRFRRERERNKRYTYGDQWGDVVCADGRSMTEEDYIRSQGRIPLKNNHIRKLVRSVVGVYRSQDKEPTCTARDRDEQELSETMSTVLQYVMQLNRMQEVNARSMEEFLISGLVVHRKSFGWRNGRAECWTDYVNPNNVFIDNNARDFRGWDVSVIGEVHDIPFGTLCSQFATSPEEFKRLREIYRHSVTADFVSSMADRFGYSRLENYDFLLTTDPGLCRVIELWRKEQKPRWFCHDPQNGEIFKIEVEDYGGIEEENARRMAMAREAGMAENDVPLIRAEWRIDDYWRYYYLSPFGDILSEGETPYDHGSHPYVFKAYPFIDGEIHSFVADVIDQQRYVNHLITLYDWIMKASAKGVLMIPDDGNYSDKELSEIADEWARFNGVIVYRPGKSGQMPQQVVNNSVNIGINELLNLQLKFFEDISGVTGALQGKAGFSGESFAHYNQQTQNATTTLLDILEAFSSFTVDGAYKDVKNIQQFTDEKKMFN
ncbi:MAG: hypothetical protein LUC33_04850, partial [Prevotellaceae bacterium]|nr:hypothetical protein [Prevotellaceae bacterium]